MGVLLSLLAGRGDRSVDEEIDRDGWMDGWTGKGMGKGKERERERERPFFLLSSVIMLYSAEGRAGAPTKHHHRHHNELVDMGVLFFFFD